MNEHPEIVEELSGKLMGIKVTMVDSSWCPASTTAAEAEATFNETMFVSPWLADAGYSCNISCADDVGAPVKMMVDSGAVGGGEQGGEEGREEGEGWAEGRRRRGER